jgi:hypothetical protein
MKAAPAAPELLDAKRRQKTANQKADANRKKPARQKSQQLLPTPSREPSPEPWAVAGGGSPALVRLSGKMLTHMAVYDQS